MFVVQRREHLPFYLLCESCILEKREREREHTLLIAPPSARELLYMEAMVYFLMLQRHKTCAKMLEP